VATLRRRIDVSPSLLIHYVVTKEQMTVELADCLLEVFHEACGDKLTALADPHGPILGLDAA